MNPIPTSSTSKIVAGLLSRRRFLGGATAALAALKLQAADRARRVIVWSEGTAPVDEVYREDINTAIAQGLKKHLTSWRIETASLDSPEQGCSLDSLNDCDVLIWWGHKRHGDVKDEYVGRIVKRVREGGMGFISVHSSHFAKPNKALMGTRCSWGAYENDGCRLRVKVALPDHPITKNVPDFELPNIERYSEPYAVPEPEATPFTGTYIYPDGKEETTRVGLCWTIGKGRMFYFVPGHETYPGLYREDIQQIFANAVNWAALVVRA